MKRVLAVPVLLLQGGLLCASGAEYDFIVVGGGCAGCAAAKVLAGKGKTLLLERGKPLSAYDGLINREYWQKTISTDAVKWYATPFGLEAQGNAMGGGSSVNVGVVVHPGDAYFDAIGLTNRTALARAWSAVTSIAWDEPVEPGSLEEAMEQLFDDHLPGAERHEAYNLFAPNGGKRTAASLVDPKPENLTILTEAMVDKLLLRGTTAVGVSYRGSDGAALEAHLRDADTSRVFVAAGPFESPAILMRSGIGRRAELEGLGIDVVAEDEGMGSFEERSPSTVQVRASASAIAARTPPGWVSAKYMAPPDVRVSGGLFYEKTGFGLGGWIAPYASAQYPAALRTEACTSFAEFGYNFIGDAGVAAASNQFGAVGLPVRPVFRGTVALTSADPGGPLSVGLAYLDNATAVLEEGRRKVLSMMGDASLDGFCEPTEELTQNAALKQQYSQLAACPSDPILDACVADPAKCISHRNILPLPNETTAPELYATLLPGYAFPNWHATGGAASALDADYKVRGLDRVFVLDSSAAPTLPPVNPMGTFMTLGYYVADMNSEVVHAGAAPDPGGLRRAPGALQGRGVLREPLEARGNPRRGPRHDLRGREDGLQAERVLRGALEGCGHGGAVRSGSQKGTPFLGNESFFYWN
eukprot:CAMPEP_0179321818 /NCGR_PEP_ID=MMETSP0797-20121207/58837_1 /TAXON_ID=47934 /ORGANISM="Dinophysis acuminata, Strain DAEP01" /LENGTH=642 /DNA_ID=CAMNT_0021033513 /DNA_START=27 /DNA_END=1955 /DNA_ORIENTATION=-